MVLCGRSPWRSSLSVLAVASFPVQTACFDRDLLWNLHRGTNPALPCHRSRHHTNAVGAATFLIADSLSLGALGALFFRSSFATLRNALALSACLAVVALAIITLGIPHGLMHRSNPTGAALQTIPFNLLFASGIFSTVALRLPLFSGPALRPLRALGDISYGLYLFHPMVLALYDRIFPVKSYKGHFTSELLRAFVCITFAIAMAWLSRWYYEELFLRKKKRPEAAQLASSNR